MKDFFRSLAVIGLVMATFCLAQSTMAGTTTVERNGTYERAEVERVTMGNRVTDTGGQQIETYQIKFLSGPLNGQTRDVANEIDSNPYALRLKEGETIVVLLEPEGNGETNVYIEGYDRRAAMVWLIVLFVLTLVVLSGWQGLKVAASMGISIALIGTVLIPLFLKGVNPVPVAIILAGVFVLISSVFTVGWNKKSMVTTIGTVGGTLVALLISIVFAHWAHLNGLASEEDRLFFNKNPGLDASGLLFAGIIIASMGVVEDVAVSIASGVWEVRRANGKLGFRELFKSGMTIGNDHMGALANTLVFAYVGASLSTLLLYTQFGGSWLKFINFDTVVDEVVRSLSGTIGLIFTVPITALLAAWVIRKQTITNNKQTIRIEQVHRH